MRKIVLFALVVSEIVIICIIVSIAKPKTSFDSAEDYKEMKRICDQYTKGK